MPRAGRGSAARIASSAGRGLRAAAVNPPFVVGAIVLLAAALAAFFTHQITGYDPDEIIYTRLAIGISHSLTPIALSGGGAQRLNQLYPLLIAPIWGVFGNVTAFRLVHLVNPLLMASAAIPTYLLAREVLEDRRAAYIASALVAAAPWLTLSTGELTEVAAFPASTWALLAMQRSLSKPSPARDMIAIAAIALACYGRLQLTLLAPVLVVAMLFHEFRFALAQGGDRRAALREARERILRRHAPLTVLGLLGAVVGVPLLLTGVLAQAFGFYREALSGVTLNGATLAMARDYFVFIAIGLGAIPAALALGFIGDSVLAPTARKTHAFACLALLTMLALTFQVAEISVRFEEGFLQERYLFYIVPLLAVGMCGALLNARHRGRIVLGGTIALAALVGMTHFEASRGAFWYQISPGMTSFYDWIKPAFGAASAAMASPDSSRQFLAAVVLLAVGVALVPFARRARPSRLLACVGALAILFCIVETTHGLARVVDGSASGGGFGGGSLTGVDWVDRSVPANSAVGQLVSDVGNLDYSHRLWEGSEFWNRTIARAYAFPGVADPTLPTARLHFDERSGDVDGRDGRPLTLPSPPNSDLVTVARGFPISLAGEVRAHSPNGVLELLRPGRQLHAAWAVSEISSDGWLKIDRPAILRLYDLQAGHCARVGVTSALSAISSSTRLLAVRGEGVRRYVRFAPGESRTVSVRICGRPSVVPRLELLNVQSVAASDPQVTLQLQRVAVVAL